MQPENPSQNHLQKLAQAVRNPNLPHDFPADRIAIYAQLVRNNLFHFLDKCFTETPKYLQNNQWLELKEQFIQQGAAHSPFFQDIPQQFYDFLRKNNQLPDYLFHLMDLELAQLAAETAADGDYSQNADAYTLAPSVQIREYPIEYANFFENSTVAPVGNMVIWRNAHAQVMTKNTSAVEWILLNLVAEQPMNLAQILAELAALMPADLAWQDEISRIWQQFLAENIFQAA